MKIKWSTCLFGLLAFILISVFTGCGDKTPGGDTASSGDTREPTVSGDMQICFQCNGTGKMKCPVCRDGEVDCPGNCLKLTKGEWVHRHTAGHPDTDLWQGFKVKGWTLWFNQGYVGHVLVNREGDWVDSGPCPICHGTGMVKCPTCDGTGETVCSMCNGKKVVPKAWTSVDNPRLKDRPTHFHMKDGRVLIGRKAMQLGTHATIHTATGDVEVNVSDIVSEEKPAAK